MDGIETFRDRIDEIDQQLLRMLNVRAALSIEVGRLKQEAGLPSYSEPRERAILSAVAQANVGPLSPDAVTALFQAIIDECRTAAETRLAEEAAARALRAARASRPANRGQAGGVLRPMPAEGWR